MIKELIRIFGDCSFPDLCVCNTKSPFEVITSSKFHIYDEGGESKSPVRIVTHTDAFQLTVENPHRREITICKLDNCLVNDNHSKCDCALFDSKEFYLIEIKTSAAGSRGNKRQKAYKQLDSTISLLKKNGFPFNNVNTFAIICFKSLEPRIINSANNSARAKFLEQHNVFLEEKNVITF